MSLSWNQEPRLLVGLLTEILTFNTLRCVSVDSIRLFLYGLGVFTISTHLIIQLLNHSINTLTISEDSLVVIFILIDGLLLGGLKHE